MFTLQAGAQHGVVAVGLGLGALGPADIADPISANEARTYTQEGENNFRLHNVIAFDMAQITHPENRSRVEPGLPCPSLNDSGQMHVADYCAPICDTLDTYFGTKLGLENQHINSGAPRFPVQAGIPRRLMPVECERLMSWPDGWTDVPDEKGKPASDAVRYKACGNGVVSNVAEWIGSRLMAMESV